MQTPFHEFSEKMGSHITTMLNSAARLYMVDADRDTLWKIYLDNFPEGSDPVYRTRSEHDCSSCRHFVKSFGAVVTLKDGEMTSIWDFVAPGRYGPSARALSKYIHSLPIIDQFVTDISKIGTEKDHEMLENSEVVTWDHMHVTLPSTLVNRSRRTNDTIRGDAFS